MRLLFLIIMLALPARAEDLYVSQSGAGSQDGSTLGNAWPIGGIVWGSGAGKVSSGDTLHLSGTFTSALTIAGSGTTGNSITILFETGANFTSPCWPSTGAIQLNGQSNITIDGGPNGLIQNTANGTGLANQNASAGIIGDAIFLTVRNLTITNIYNRTAGSSDTSAFGNCISITSGGNVTISNCNVSDANGVISFSGPQSGDPVRSNLFVFNNRIYNWNHGITIGLGDSNCTLLNVQIAWNTLDYASKWDGSHLQFHMDGIILENNTSNSTSVLNGIYVSNNVWGPNFVANNTTDHGGTAAIAMYLDGQPPQLQNVFIHDNVFQTYDTNSWANGYVNANGSNVWVFNNSSKRFGTNAIPRGAEINIGGTNAFVYNNIIDPGAGISFTGISYTNAVDTGNNGPNNLIVINGYMTAFWSDYNVLTPDTNGANNFSLAVQSTMAGGGVWTTGIFNTTHKWQTYIDNFFSWTPPIYNTTHCDPHSQTNTPSFIPATVIPMPGDIIAVGNGTNLSQFASVDNSGRPRPTGNWSIGAFEPQNPTPPIVTVSGPITISGGVTGIKIN